MKDDDVMKRKIYYYYFLLFSVVFAFNELLGIYMPKIFVRGVYIIMMFACFIILLIDNKCIIKIKKMDLLLLIYIVHIVIRVIFQYLINNITDVTGIATMQLLLPIGAYFLAQKLDESQSENFESFFSICVAISVFLGLIDARLDFLPNEGAFSNDLFANIGGGVTVLRGYSMCGSALTTGYMCIIALGFLIVRKIKRKKNKLFWNIISLIILVGCGLSLSRGAYAALIVMLVSYGLMTLKKGKVRKRRFYWLIFALICLIVLVVLFHSEIVNSNVYQRMFVVGISMSDGSNRARVNWQMDAIKAFFDEPILGRGLGFCGYQAASNNVSGLINTESYFLSILISLGIVGLFIFCLILIKTFRRCITSPYNYKYYAILFGILAWSVLYIVLDSDLTAMCFWYCVGMIQKNNNKYSVGNKID